MARQGLVVDMPAEPASLQPGQAVSPVGQDGLSSPPQPATPAQQPLQAPQPNVASPVPESPTPLTLADVATLTPQDDFSPFVARTVAPEVRNAAMKKLFADPAFNVMDGLDIYIDDYSRPDPLPAAMVHRLLQDQMAQVLKPAEDQSIRHVPAPQAAMASEPETVPAPDGPSPEAIADTEPVPPLVANASPLNSDHPAP